VSLIDVRKEIAKHYAVALPAVRVEEHGGRMDLEEIKRWATGAPALIVACLGVPSVSVEGGMTVAEASWAVCILTRNVPGEFKDVASMALVGAVLAGLPTQRWAGTASKMPKNIRADNAYSSTLDKLGVSLWLISWQQAVDLPETTYAELADLLRLYTTYERADGIEDDTVPMEGHVDLEATP
jgi:hypothetical protein